jgi:hypothetical protein
LPALTTAGDTVVFTDRRFEFYLFDTDKSAARRLLVAKHTQPDILTAIPTVLLERAKSGHIWLVTDDLDNRELAYATELWLRRRGQPVGHYRFGDSVQLTKFQLNPAAPWSALTPLPAINRPFKTDEYRFNGIASLQGWDWPALPADVPPALAAGQTYPLDLYWIYHGKSPDDHFFVRLLNPASESVTESMAAPSPENREIPGQLNLETAEVKVPPTLPPGMYTLQVGFTTAAVETGELTFALSPEVTQIRVEAAPPGD